MGQRLYEMKYFDIPTLFVLPTIFNSHTCAAVLPSNYCRLTCFERILRSNFILAS